MDQTRVCCSDMELGQSQLAQELALESQNQTPSYLRQKCLWHLPHGDLILSEGSIA